jgi:hypothetical protein
MNEEIKEPEPITLTAEEFIERLRTEWCMDIRRAYNKILFERNPEKYRRMGLNEHLEREDVVSEKLVLPLCSIRRLQDMAYDSNVSIEVLAIDEPEIIMLLARGTPTNMECFKRALLEMSIPDEAKASGAIKFLDLPQNAEESIIGKNGVNVYKIQDEYGVTARIINSSGKVLAISGEPARVDSACEHVLSLMYKNLS